MRFLPAFAFILIFTAALPALAKPAINDAGAAKVKTLVQNMIDQQSKMHMSKTSQFVADGDIQVEQAKSYYAVTLPDITIVSQHEEKGETKKLIAKIGIIGLNVLPTDNENEWKMTLAIPTPIKYLDENNKTLMKLDIGQQQMVGVWNEDLNAFADLNGQYRDLLLHNNEQDSGKKLRIRVGQ
jgi:hypothetical protein